MRSALAARLAASDGGASSREGDAQAGGKDGAAAGAGADKSAGGDKGASSPSTLQAQLAAQKASNAALQSELTALKAQLKARVTGVSDRAVRTFSLWEHAHRHLVVSTLTSRRCATHVTSASRWRRSVRGAYLRAPPPTWAVC